MVALVEGSRHTPGARITCSPAASFALIALTAVALLATNTLSKPSRWGDSIPWSEAASHWTPRAPRLHRGVICSDEWVSLCSGCEMIRGGAKRERGRETEREGRRERKRERERERESEREIDR